MHNLTINKLTGKAEMFYVQETPWHGLGTRVESALTSEEALKAASLDWTVSKLPLNAFTGDGQNIGVPTHRAVRRDDTGDILGVVGAGFRLIQNRESFSILDELVGSQEAMFHTAGSLGNGERIWCLAKLPGSLVVVGDDVIDQYLLLANGHDGSLALTMRFTPIRVVCQNTLSAALGSRMNGKRQKRVENGVYIRHSDSAEVRIAEARRVLGVSLKYFEVAGESYRAMSAKQINDAMFKGYLDAVFPPNIYQENPTDDEREAAIGRQQKVHETVAFLFNEGRGNQLPGVQGTVWAAFNAATEYIDHVNVLTKAGTPKVGGFASAVFGQGQTARQRAYDGAVALLSA